MSEHTAGPWKAESYGPFAPLYEGKKNPWNDFAFKVVGANGYQPCLVFRDGYANRGLAEANGRLIAAAPDLLEALEKIAAYDPTGQDYAFAFGYVQQVAHLAIAKARGES